MNKGAKQTVYRETLKPVDLSPKLKEMLRLLAAGKTTHQCAPLLGITERSSECYRQKIMELTGCRTPVTLGVWAAQHGYAPSDKS